MPSGAGMAGVQLQRLAGAITSLALLILLLGSSNPSFSSRAHPSHATDTISVGRSLSGNQTIVSGGGQFELGFFTPGNCRYYVGIWYKNIPVQTVIWVANREAPLSSTASSELKLSPDGNLVLVISPPKIPVWSSNITHRKLPGSTAVAAVLLDTGNLVLRETRGSRSRQLWQSFDHPTDTWLPDMVFGMNKMTGEYQVLTSWRNSQDPAPGMYSHRLKLDGSNGYINVWNGSVVYDETGVWNGHAFDLIPQMSLNPNLKFRFVETREHKYMACTACNRSTPVRMVMDFTGQMKISMWVDEFQKWQLIWTKPTDQCDVFSICGAFGVCDQRRNPPCSCLPGFEPKFSGGWDLGDWSGGCARRSPLQCAEDVFSAIPDVKLPTNPSIILPAVRADQEYCKLACSNDCGCSAYAYDGAICRTWNGQLHNLQQLSSSGGADGHGGTLHLRLAATEQQQQQHSRTQKVSSKNLPLTIAGSILGAFLVILLSSIALFMIKYWRSWSAVGEGTVEESITLFKYSDLQQITNKFSTLLGRGGFGSVFAGILPDATLVAVKRLQGLRQGEKQFRAEVTTLGKVQHANLVRLRGFCAEGDDKRLLVYDYMPGGSLDSHLFRAPPSPCLDWRTRFEVAVGTARGLAYLHEQCPRERIIHCDVKPENILLDGAFRPKVADFGMAKLVARDLSRVLTTVRGTIGYLAPEWLTGLPITPKADVYSFGMVLFELVSGRRNTDMLVRDGEGAAAAAAYFPLLAAVEISEGGDVLRLLDRRLAPGDADVEELTRVCMAACWCVQDEESCRPTMGEVVRILEGVVVACMPPISRSLQCLGGLGYGSSLSV